MAEGSADQTARAPELGRRTVHLTFDAEHPDRAHHRVDGAHAVLDALTALDVTATFFLQGRWASANPQVARRIALEGHAIGSHSNSHLMMTRLSDAGLVAEVTESQKRIQEATGVDPRPYFRCPYGEGHHDAQVVAALAALGYGVVDWDVDPRDWDPALGGVAALVTAVHEGLARSAAPSPIVLLHSWPMWTPDAVRQVVESAGDELVWAPLGAAAALE